jgi:4a-hydroxytetrahydrobiopterin dehydratase
LLIESLLVLSTAEKVSRLSIEQLEVMTKGLDKLWKIEDQILTREFLFSSYEASIVFVNSVAQLAENQNHHPTILIIARF